MSLYGMMRTGVSGMNAQSTRLATVADNIANSGTNGYKRASVEFSSMIIPNAGTSYVSGGVGTQIRYAMSTGPLQNTISTTDLAIDGNGFFVVQDASGQPFLTRAGSFIPDANGNLVNAAGFYLMGRSFALGEPGASSDFSDFQRVTIPTSGLERVASTFGKLASNLPFNAPVHTGATPSSNPSVPTAIEDGMANGSIHKSSLTAIGNAGEPIRLDIYFTKTGANEWEVTVFHQPSATATSAFPYMTKAMVQETHPVTGDPIFDPVTGDPVMVEIDVPATPLSTQTMNFDPASGRLDAGAASALTLDLGPLNGQEVEIDLSGMRELAFSYTPLEADMNGSAPAAIDRVVIDAGGIVSVQYENGAAERLYRIDLAFVQSPDQLSVLPGNVFAEGRESGKVNFGKPNELSLGAIVSGAIENSNVDIAEELTNMIESQRNYTANSKVFQTGSDLMDILVNLKR